MKTNVRRKNYRIDTRKLARARKALGTRTETETIHRALDIAAAERELARAVESFIELDRSSIDFDDGK